MSAQILNEERAVSPDTALRLARYFGGNAQTWLNLQAAYDVKKPIAESGADIEITIRPMPTVAA